MFKQGKFPIWGIVLAVGLGASALGQTVTVMVRPLAANVIVPQTRSFRIVPVLPEPVPRPRPGAEPVQVTGVEVEVDIRQQHATTSMDISLRNPNPSRQEAELIVPVPDGVVVRGFTFQGAGSEPKAELLPKDVARRTYDEIVSRVRDPALLEFIGYNLVRSSVFPVEGHGTQKVRLTYESLLEADGERIDYVLPRSESVEYAVPWQISVRIESKQPISTVYSPSHRLQTVRSSPHEVSVRITAEATNQPGAFRLSYLLERNGVTASLIAYPDPKVGGGYFLLLAGLPARPPQGGQGPAIKREVILVLDRSGSMNGEKIEQVREAALQVLAGLEDGEAFNIIVYNEGVDVFSTAPVRKTDENMSKAREYLRSVKARGGTNIHDALLEALRQKPQADILPIVLFLTDGLPTIGQTSEVAIRDIAIKGNPYKRRVFTFGVGVDVNAPLLQRIADETRATATFVLPKEDVEVKVAQVFKRLMGPVLADPELEIIGSDGGQAPHRVRDVIPQRLPDLFESDQLVVLGQYLGDQPLNFRVSGNYLGKQRRFEFSFDLDKATTRNAFVPRLWASRKIGLLVDAIRQLGGDGELLSGPQPTTRDPKIKELVDEVVRLSTEFGILTEYTAFLAREGTDLSSPQDVLLEAGSFFSSRALGVRSGLGAVSQDKNLAVMKSQEILNTRNYYYDANMNQVSITAVQQVNDRAFYRKGGQWVDSRIVNEAGRLQPQRVIEFGSQEFQQLATQLANEGRQGVISLRGDILMVVNNESVLVKGPAGN